jgi:hypothetical protein
MRYNPFYYCSTANTYRLQEAGELAAAAGAEAEAAALREAAATREAACGREEVERLRALLQRADLEAQGLLASLKVWARDALHDGRERVPCTLSV